MIKHKTLYARLMYVGRDMPAVITMSITNVYYPSVYVLCGKNIMTVFQTAERLIISDHNAVHLYANAFLEKR